MAKKVGGIKMGRGISGIIEDITMALSAFLLVGVFGGVEQETIADWKLIPAIILIIIINMAVVGLTKIKEIR